MYSEVAQPRHTQACNLCLTSNVLEFQMLTCASEAYASGPRPFHPNNPSHEISVTVTLKPLRRPSRGYRCSPTSLP